MTFHRKAMWVNATALFGILLVANGPAMANADGCMLRMPAQNDAIGMKVAAVSTTKQPVKEASLYDRLGGYDAIRAVVDDLMVRLVDDPKLGRFWAHTGEDGIKREKQLVVDFIVNKAGGTLNYGGRDMEVSHKGIRISEQDWTVFMKHLNATLVKFKVPSQEKTDVVDFMESLKKTMVEV